MRGIWTAQGSPPILQFICRATLVATLIIPLGLLWKVIIENRRNRTKNSYLRTVEVMHCEGMGLSQQATFLMAA